PAGSTCTFSPAAVTPGNSPAVVVLSVSTLKTSAELRHGAPTTDAQLLVLMFLPGMALSLSGGIGSRKAILAVLLIVVLAALLLQPGCGGGSSAGTLPPPTPTPTHTPQPDSTTYRVIITATSDTVQDQLQRKRVVEQQ